MTDSPRAAAGGVEEAEADEHLLPARAATPSGGGGGGGGGHVMLSYEWGSQPLFARLDRRLREPRASLSLRADIHLSVFDNSYDRL
jgi:hypothetical protein